MKAVGDYLYGILIVILIIAMFSIALFVQLVFEFIDFVVGVFKRCRR
jgi:hypothetical protein